MNLFDPVKTIMSTELITVSQNDPLNLVEKIFTKNRIHHILVVQESKLIGIVSREDYNLFQTKYLNQYQQDRESRKHKVSEIMTTRMAKLDPDDKITVALEVFKENILRALPIVVNDLPVGIITPYDIIKNLSEDNGAVSTYNL